MHNIRHLILNTGLTGGSIIKKSESITKWNRIENKETMKLTPSFEKGRGQGGGSGYGYIRIKVVLRFC